MSYSSTSTPKSKARLESEIERNREEGHWKRCLELAQQLPVESNSQLVQFLLGETKLELFLESDKQSSSSSLLKEAKKHLISCVSGSNTSPLFMDANLLLAKSYYISGDYEEALKCIEISGIDTVTQVEKPLPLRVMKLVAESFAVRGMSLDKGDEQNHEFIITCLTKASDLTIRYLQNIEKQHGPYTVVNVGPILEVAIQRAAIELIESGKVDKAVIQYRNLMNACETQSTLNTRQIISRQLAEIIMRGVSKSVWTPFDTSITTSSGPWKPLRYFGQSLFVPKTREEEVILLLIISEMLASRNVVLDRGPEFHESRIQSLDNVMAVYDLMTIFYTPLKNYVYDMFERAMKFSFEVKHIWFQFAMTLMESKKCPARAVKLFEEVARIDPHDPLPCLLASKICILELDQPEEALRLAEKAFERNNNEALLSKIHVIIGMASALVVEEATETVKKLKSDYAEKAIENFKLAIKVNPSDHLPYFHLALTLARQRSINEAIENAQTALLLNPEHIPTIQLLILCLSSLKQYDEALKLCEAALEEFPDQLLLLYIKAHLEEVLCDDGREVALLTAKHMLKCCKIAASGEQEKVTCGDTVNLTGTNYDTMSLRMEQTLSEVASVDSAPVQIEGMSITGSNAASSMNLGSKKLWNFHIHVWMLVAELFIKLNQISEAESCVEGASAIFGPLSHQFMYLKGILHKAKGQLIEAKICFQNAISINPKHAKALQQLGHTYHLLGNHVVADKYLRDSLKMDASLHETWSFMGSVLDTLGDHNRASTCQMTALQLEATSPILSFNVVPRTVFE
ncbi:tetratricopeptide repeat protein 5-like protein [Dinothrombium tinctorium]|uniref:Tetratricopeptide repeat protein 5-like protein n=1 Tax=Dinothrombium tinctorium TaxID=1965070 RepID=A0A443QE86_9ACAR|nr:tetratricopeptide repeat protein 5-like protein [Dinothrombium tinctorium]